MLCHLPGRALHLMLSLKVLASAWASSASACGAAPHQRQAGHSACLKPVSEATLLLCMPAKPVAWPVNTLVRLLRRQLWEHALSKDAMELLPALKRLAVESTVSSCWDA